MLNAETIINVNAYTEHIFVASTLLLTNDVLVFHSLHKWKNIHFKVDNLLNTSDITHTSSDLRFTFYYTWFLHHDFRRFDNDCLLFRFFCTMWICPYKLKDCSHRRRQHYFRNERKKSCHIFFLSLAALGFSKYSKNEKRCKENRIFLIFCCTIKVSVNVAFFGIFTTFLLFFIKHKWKYIDVTRNAKKFKQCLWKVHTP